MTNWPQDADGDVFRRLDEDGFDFGVPHAIDFNIDLKDWPPPSGILQIIRDIYPSALVREVPDGDLGYILVQLREKLTYEFVVSVQGVLTEAVKKFGAVCDSWGILH